MAYEVQSPCNDICRLNEERVCIGCGRTAREISEWTRVSDSRKRIIREHASARLRELTKPDD